jgi:hypothetical protein
LVAPIRNISYGGGSVVALVRVVRSGMPRSQQQLEVHPSGRYPSAISWRPLLATKLRPGTHRPTPLSGVYIQPRALCSRAEGITDYRLQITGCRLQAIRMGLHAAARLVHADSNETSCYAIRETTPKAKKKRRIVQVSSITECTGGWPWVLPTRLRHTAAQPQQSREYLRPAAAPARPMP